MPKRWMKSIAVSSALVLLSFFAAFSAPKTVMAAAPSAPTINATSGASIGLSWSSPAGATSFEVYRGTSSGGESLLFTTTSTVWDDKNVSPKTTYYYTAKAVNADGASPYSSEVSATTPPPPPSISGFNVTATSYDTQNSTAYAEDIAKYVISFKINDGTIPSGKKITVHFPPSFDLSAIPDLLKNPASNDPNGAVLSASPSSLTGSFLPSDDLVFTASSDIADGSTITLTANYIVTGPIPSDPPNQTEVKYTISADIEGSPTNFPSGSKELVFPSAPSTPAAHGFLECFLSPIRCVKDAITQLPQIIIEVWSLTTFKILFAIIGKIFDIIGATLISISTGFMLAMLTYSKTYMFAPTSAASIGFPISLQIVNIGFVVAIIVIGFATILHKESYGMRKALPRLLITAVLINFSLFFMKQIVILSDDLTGVFNTGTFESAVKGIMDNPFKNELNTISSILHPSSDPPSSTAIPAEIPGADIANGFIDSIVNGLSGLLSDFISPFFKFFFYLIAVFVILAITIMFLIRYVILSLLAIVLPFALLLGIFENLKLAGFGNAWEKWLEQFTKWVIFGPVCMFFVWLAFQLPSDSVVSMIAKLGILVGGLLIANSLGLKGSKAAGALSGWTMRRGAGLAMKYGTKGYGAAKERFGRKDVAARAEELGRFQHLVSTMEAPQETPQEESQLDMVNRLAGVEPTPEPTPSEPTPPSTATMTPSQRYDAALKRIAEEREAARTAEVGVPSAERVDATGVTVGAGATPAGSEGAGRLNIQAENVNVEGEQIGQATEGEAGKKKPESLFATTAEKFTKMTGMPLTKKGIFGEGGWTSGGDDFPTIMKGGAEEFFGKLGEGPLKGLFGKNKAEEYNEKMEKVDKIKENFNSNFDKYWEEVRTGRKGLLSDKDRKMIADLMTHYRDTKLEGQLRTYMDPSRRGSLDAKTQRRMMDLMATHPRNAGEQDNKWRDRIVTIKTHDNINGMFDRTKNGLATQKFIVTNKLEGFHFAQAPQAETHGIPSVTPGAHEPEGEHHEES